MYDVMIRREEYSSKEVIKWLDILRKDGIEYSYIKDRKITADEILVEIESIIADLESFH